LIATENQPSPTKTFTTTLSTFKVFEEPTQTTMLRTRQQLEANSPEMTLQQRFEEEKTTDPEVATVENTAYFDGDYKEAISDADEVELPRTAQPKMIKADMRTEYVEMPSMNIQTASTKAETATSSPTKSQLKSAVTKNSRLAPPKDYTADIQIKFSPIKTDASKPELSKAAQKPKAEVRPATSDSPTKFTPNKFRNDMLEQETAKINAEFQKLLMQSPGPGKKSEKTGRFEDVGMDKFYEIMGEFYSSDMRKHASPTKRLMQQKDAAWKHKAFLAKKITATQDY